MKVSESSKIEPTYRSSVLTTKAHSAPATVFNCPCDKMYIKGFGELELKQFMKFRSLTPISFPRGYSAKNSYRFGIFNADIMVYQNYSGYLVQINPSQFRSYLLMNYTLLALLGEYYSHAVIFKVHLFVDVKRSLEDVYKSINVSFKRRTLRYTPAKLKKTKAGKLEEVSFTVGFGSEKSDCVKIYNSHTKHGLQKPSTRIERQFSKARFCPINKLSDFRNLLEVDPFNNVKLFNLLDTSELTGVDNLRFRLLDCRRRSIGLHATIAELRALDPKHFNRNFRKIIKLLDKVQINLKLSYRNKMNGFLKRKLSEDEILALKDLGAIHE